ncbi:hypothetical protein NQ315_001377, partial [Exocentrus adspersus]
RATDELEEWCNRWQVAINADKSTGIIVTRRPTQRRAQEVTINGEAIQWSNNVKYLGVHPDRTMTWGHHVAETIRTAKIARARLYSLLCGESVKPAEQAAPHQAHNPAPAHLCLNGVGTCLQDPPQKDPSSREHGPENCDQCPLVREKQGPISRPGVDSGARGHQGQSSQGVCQSDGPRKPPLTSNMDPDDESAAYLKYLNDPSTSNNYLLSNGVELADAFPFAEIESTDWPSESFPVLLSSPLITETEGNENGTIIQAANIKRDNIQELVQSSGTDEMSPTSCVPIGGHTVKNCIAGKFNGKTYINYDPIVKEDPDGNKEIYLTEKDINNDATVIQLFNTDGSVITIDKSILSSLDLPKKVNKEREGSLKKKYNDHYISVIANKCKICNLLCETEEQIVHHIDENHSELLRQEDSTQKQLKSVSLLKINQKDNKEYTIFLCSICNLACSEKEELRNHMIDNHEVTHMTNNLAGDKIYIAESNGDTDKLSKAVSLDLIKHQEKARKKIKCSRKGCNLRFARDDLRQSHEECHIGETVKQFKCPKCEEKFSIWRVCTNHVWKCHKIDLGLLTCPMCSNFKSNSSVRVLNHMATHDEERPFLCSDCGKGFKTMVQLKNHEVTHKKPEDMPNWSVMRRCTICERFFANSKCLKKHIQSVHENFRPFICNICGHKTARKAMLELHLRQHTGDKPHECSYCEYRTGDHNCLRKHVMRHLGAKKYSCPHCPYTSIQSAAYKSHINNRHPGQSGAYSCSYCSYTCINFADYSAHLKRHEAALRESGMIALILIRNFNRTGYSVYYGWIDDIEDDDIQNCFLNSNQIVEETIDTGGVTIPAGLERQLVL